VSTLLEWDASKVHYHTSADKRVIACRRLMLVDKEEGGREEGRNWKGQARAFQTASATAGREMELHLDPSLHPLISYIPRPLHLASSFHSISSSSLVLSQTLNGGESMAILACSSPLRQQSPPAKCPMFSTSTPFFAVCSNSSVKNLLLCPASADATQAAFQYSKRTRTHVSLS
jgi:hypothetical protein